MGATEKYGIQYPESDDLVKDGATAMQTLAEDTEDALLEPLLILQATGDDSDIDGRLVWNTAAPVRQRGSWTYPAGGKLVIPPSPGLYLVVVGYEFNELGGVGSSGGGSGETVIVRVFLEHKVSGADQATAAAFMVLETSPIDQDFSPKLNVTGLAYIDATADRGIQVRAVSPDLITPGAAADPNARLQIYRLSRI